MRWWLRTSATPALEEIPLAQLALPNVPRIRSVHVRNTDLFVGLDGAQGVDVQRGSVEADDGVVGAAVVHEGGVGVQVQAYAVAEGGGHVEGVDVELLSLVSFMYCGWVVVGCVIGGNN